MVVVEGETVILLPVSNSVLLQESENHSAVAPVPAEPPFIVKVVEFPIQIVEFPVNPVGAVDSDFMVKFEAEVTGPPGVVTVIVPVLAPFGSIAVIWESLFTVKEAETLLNLTDEVLLR